MLAFRRVFEAVAKPTNHAWLRCNTDMRILFLVHPVTGGRRHTKSTQAAPLLVSSTFVGSLAAIGTTLARARATAWLIDEQEHDQPRTQGFQ